MHHIRSEPPSTGWVVKRQEISSTTSLAMGRWSPNDELVGADRIKACVPYLLPLIDGDQFGKYIYYTRFPLLGEINDFVMGPLVNLQHKIPFFGVGIFILLTLGTRFNTDMNRNVRFNAQQAALLDVALIIPELIAQGFVDDPLPRYIAEPCANFVWYSYMSIVLYCLYSNLTGKKPDQIPFLSPSAELMVGPF
jgi:Chloroplast import apparatus Tic20-like